MIKIKTISATQNDLFVQAGISLSIWSILQYRQNCFLQENLVVLLKCIDWEILTPGITTGFGMQYTPTSS